MQIKRKGQKKPLMKELTMEEKKITKISRHIVFYIIRESVIHERYYMMKKNRGQVMGLRFYPQRDVKES